MSNFLLKEPDCVFIHIPKTAGTSIRKGVWKKRYEGAVFGQIPKEWEGLFKFTFVRHPLQRLVSAYYMFTQGAEGDSEWKLPKDARALTISEFIDIVIDETIIFDERRKTFEEKIRHHTIPQTHPFNCLHLADFVGRYENIDNDFKYICDTLGIDEKLPKMHTTHSVEWEDLLEGDDLDKCIAFYRNDFETLGYTYEKPKDMLASLRKELNNCAKDNPSIFVVKEKIEKIHLEYPFNKPIGMLYAEALLKNGNYELSLAELEKLSHNFNPALVRLFELFVLYNELDRKENIFEILKKRKIQKRVLLYCQLLQFHLKKENMELDFLQQVEEEKVFISHRLFILIRQSFKVNQELVITLIDLALKIDNHADIIPFIHRIMKETQKIFILGFFYGKYPMNLSIVKLYLERLKSQNDMTKFFEVYAENYNKLDVDFIPDLYIQYKFPLHLKHLQDRYFNMVNETSDDMLIKNALKYYIDNAENDKKEELITKLKNKHIKYDIDLFINVPKDRELKRKVLNNIDANKEVIISSSKDSVGTVLFFSGILINKLSEFATMERYFAACNLSVIYLRDSSNSFFIKGIPEFGDFERTLGELKNIINEINAPKLFTFGRSSGGFATILYGCHLNADAILCFSPLSSITDEFKAIDSRGSKAIGDRIAKISLGFKDKDLKLLIEEKKPKAIDIFYGEESESDKLHAMHLSGTENVTLHALSNFGDHNSLNYAAYKFGLLNILHKYYKVGLNQ